ncbi:MAG TPA: ABC transporter substrate-binding protein [Ilumatobacteraceae bacterium]|nr:ABC transporter substrate-binding protein [Ilumatobacteraceae bacterium]
MRRTLLVVVSLIVAGCANGADDEGRQLEIFGPYREVEADNFAASLSEFEEATGIEVRYTGSADFVRDLRQRVESGISAPDIAIVPQPGLVEELIDNRALVAFDETTRSAVRTAFSDEALAALSVDGGRFSAPFRQSVKSLVWYRPAVFEQYRWSVPETLDELSELVDEIQTDDPTIAPWCFSTEAGSATGWAATDWVEDLVLRRAGPEFYDEWAAGERRFGDPAVTAALAEFDALVIAAGRSTGGLPTILQTAVSDGSAPLFGDRPACAMYKQASFAESWFPDGALAEGDVDFFVLPGVEAGEPAPLVIGEDLLVQFSDDPAVHRLMTHLVSPDGAREWAARGGFFNARSDVDPDTYFHPGDRRFAVLIGDERILRPDASDAMPPAIGSDLVWREITAWIAGTNTTQEFTDNMDVAYADAPR